MSDCPQIQDIFKYYIRNTSATPEWHEPTKTDFEEKITKLTEFYPLIVLEQDQHVMGFANANKYRITSGNQWSAETSIYLSPDSHGHGLGYALYHTLLSILKLQNFVNAFAGIVLPNKKSLILHEKMGFTTVGVFQKSIYKFNQWHDTKWLQLKLCEHVATPLPTRSINDIQETIGFIQILEQVNRTIVNRGE
jgi:L-amino acid N-acyltransferase YncA